MNNDSVTALILYDAACRAVAECKTVDEAKDLRDKAEAMRAYAHQAKNRNLEIDAAAIRMRAERRGELIAAQKATVGLASGGQPYQQRRSTGADREPVASPRSPMPALTRSCPPGPSASQPVPPSSSKRWSAGGGSRSGLRVSASPPIC